MGPGVNANLKVLLKWRCDIPPLYPEKDSDLHLQMWWIRWGSKIFKNIPFWRNVSGYFLAKYIYEIDNRLSGIKSPPLLRLIEIIGDVNDLHFIRREGYEAFLLSGGVTTYFNTDQDLYLICIKRMYEYYQDSDIHAKLISLYGDCNAKSARFMETDSHLVDIIIVGNGRDDTGLGVDKLTHAQALGNLGLVTHIQSNDEPITKIAPINFMSLPFPSVYVHYMKDVHSLLDSALNIVAAPWELPKLPGALVPYAEKVDGIFYSSNFVKEGYPPSILGKLAYLPPVVEIPQSLHSVDVDFLSEGDFKILVVFDLSSYQSRKNPFASLEAYVQAFPQSGKTRLYIKINSSKYESEQLSTLMQHISNLNRKDIIVVDRTFSREELFYVYSRMDVLLHLHRSEGFGRNIAEFMKLGKPVICTNFSGNVDYCTDQNSLLVGYDEITVAHNEYLFCEDQYWAAPHVDEAANHLKALFMNKVKLGEYGLNAKETIDSTYTLENASSHLKTGLLEFLS